MATTIQLKFIKADAAPSIWEPNAVYFIKSNGYAESVVTATDGTPEEIGNSQMIEGVTADIGYLTLDTLPPYPVIPADISAFNNDAGYITAADIPPGFSGDYNDLTNKPFIPSKVSDLSNDIGFITAGSTNLLTNKSGLISQWTNNANYLTLATLPPYPTVPTNVSAFTNDAGYITASSSNALTNKSGAISQWTNDAGYITANSINALTNKSGSILQWTNDANYAVKTTVNLWTANQEIRLITEQLRLSYDATNFAAFAVGPAGILTITSSATVAGTIIPNGLATAASSTGANLCVGSGSGSNFSSASFGFTGSIGGVTRVSLKGTASSVVATSYNYANLFVGSSPFTKAASGIHDIAASVAIRPIGTITAGAATLNNTVSLYVEGATTGGILGNYAMWVDAGTVRFDEVLNLQPFTNSSPVNNDFWNDGTNLKFRIGGVTKTITWT